MSDGYAYKIGSKKLHVNYDSDKITVSGTVLVNIYYGIGKWGIIKIGSQSITHTSYFYASTWLD